MNRQIKSPSLFTRIQYRLAAARFFTFSALLHTVIVVGAGGIVIFSQPREEPDFEVGDAPFLEDARPSKPEFTPVGVTVSADQVVLTPATATSLPALTVNTTTPTSFQVSNGFAIKAPTTAVVATTSGVRGSMTGALGKGVAGGTMKPFGSMRFEGGSFAGTFYDLKQTRGKRPTNVSPDEYGQIFMRFVKEGWKEAILNEYFHSPHPLYATQIVIPNMPADEGPKAFNLEKKVQPSRWLVHYKGRVSPPRSGRYHFVGGGDDVLMVRFDNRLVLERNWNTRSDWKPQANYDYGFSRIPNGFAKGDAVDVREGEWYEMEILIGEQPGGLVFACLMLEEEGVQYAKDGKGNPILPFFRVADTPPPQLESGQTLPPFLPDGPVWKAASMRGNQSSGPAVF